MAFLSFKVLAQTPEVDKLRPEAEEALNHFKKADSTLVTLLDAAEGYAIFPKIGKGGLVIGGAHGNGLLYQKEGLLGSVSMSQVTVGAQIGGQEFSELILFETKEALDAFKESKYEMTAQAGAVAAAEGASKNAKYVDGVVVFTRPVKGLMAEATVGGQKFKFTPLVK